MAPRSPMRLSSPKAMASLPTLSMAPSPKSSPRETLIMLPASTKSIIASFACRPRRPALPASWFSCSRPVRVSIFFRSSLRSRTAASASPVYLRVSAIASSIVANSPTLFLIASDRPVMVPIICVNAPQFRLSPFHNQEKKPSFCLSGRCMSCTFLSSVFSCFNLLVISSTLPPVRSVSRSCSLRSLMEYSMSRTEAELSFANVRSISSVSLATCNDSFPACSSSLL